MSTTNTLRRQVLRTAAAIHEHLVSSARIAPLPALDADAWKELQVIAGRFELVRQRGWRAAADSLLSDLTYSANRVCREIEVFKMLLPRTLLAEGQVTSAAEIAKDLFALEHEFEELQIYRKAHTIEALTLPIELEGACLGPFRIILTWDRIGQEHCYDVVAEEPNAAEDNSHVTHPHVESERLCEGEGSTAIRSALSQGRLLDFFTLVRQVLETYNPGSAYIPLSRWGGGSDCNDCGRAMYQDESWSCDRCSESVCDDCHNSCQGCDATICGSCSATCTECEETFCGHCLSSRPQSKGRFCKSCLEQGEPHEETSADDPSGQSEVSGKPDPLPLAPDSECLEETLVPA